MLDSSQRGSPEIPYEAPNRVARRPERKTCYGGLFCLREMDWKDPAKMS